MACHAALGMVFHTLSFTLPAPSGYAVCLRCGAYVTCLQAVDQSCPGARATVDPPQAPLPLRGVRCALCGDPVLVDPTHREHVQLFGATCARCFDPVSMEVVHG